MDKRTTSIENLPPEIGKQFRDQSLIAMLKRMLGNKPGKVKMSIAEIDGTGDWIMTAAVDVTAGTFVFELIRKTPGSPTSQ